MSVDALNIPHKWLYLLPGKALGIFEENSVMDRRRQHDLILDTDLLCFDFSGCNLVWNLLYPPFSPDPNSLLPENYDFMITIILNDDLM